MSVFDPLRQACTGLAELATRKCRTEPALWLALPIFFGTLAAVDSPVLGSLGFAGALGLAAHRHRRATLGMTALFLGTLLHIASRAPDTASPITPTLTYRGEIAALPLREQPALCAVTLTPAREGTSIFASLFSQPTRWALQLPTPQACPEPGSQVRFRGLSLPVEGATNPGGFDEARWLRTQDISCKLAIESLDSLAPPSWRWRAALALRARVQEALRRTLPESRLPIVLSTVLGDMKALSRPTKSDFQNTGMLHILAISGQHIALMVAIAVQAGQFVRLPQRLACILIAAFLMLYGPATGNSPSVVRSIAMFWWLLPPLLLRRPTSALTTLSLAAATGLIAEPEIIDHVGWRLSYLATLVLLLHARPLEAWAHEVTRRIPRPLRRWRGAVALTLTALLLSLVVTAATLPIIADSSHVLMPAAPLANLVTVPLGTGLLTCAFLTCALATLSPLPALGFLHWPAQALGASTGCFAWALEACVHALAQWRGGLLTFTTWPGVLGMLWMLTLLAWPCFAPLWRRKALFFFLLFSTAIWACACAYENRHPHLRASLLDVGQGQAMLLEMGDAVILIDAGPAKPDAGYRTILPALRALGHNRIDAVLLSHADADHIGGLASLLPEIDIGRVALGGVWAHDGLWPGLLAELQRREIPVGRLLPGTEILRLGTWKLRTLDLGPADSSTRNDASAVVALEGPPLRLVVPGDIGRGPEGNLADTVTRWPRDRPFWLVVPHHGSDRTGDTAALVRMAPDVALISAGRRNRFGHPGPATLQALRGCGSRILMTPRDGAVRLDASHRALRLGFRDVD